MKFEKLGGEVFEGSGYCVATISIKLKQDGSTMWELTRLGNHVAQGNLPGS